MNHALTCPALALGLALVGSVRPSMAQDVSRPAIASDESLVPPSERFSTTRRPSRWAETDTRKAGYRNPGGVGRTLQYYPPGNRFQNEWRGAVPAPTFGGYPDGTSRALQLQAQQVGIERGAALQRHIDAYGRPIGVFWVWPAFGASGGPFWP